MLTDRGYAKLMLESKGFQRAQVVKILFGGQQALADELRISRFAVNHAIYSRSSSRRIEEHVLARIRALGRLDLEKLWTRPWAEPDRTRRNVLKIAAVMAALGLMK